VARQSPSIRRSTAWDWTFHMGCPHGLPLHSAGDLLIANLEGGSLVKVLSDGGAATNVESITRPY
jgi:hypothetical protein